MKHPDDALRALSERCGPVSALRPDDAPGWCLAAAPHKASGRLAMGSGPSRIEAWRRCLGEVAETEAITAAPGLSDLTAHNLMSGASVSCRPEKVLSLNPESLDDPGSEGAAAGPDDQSAILSAACERYERAVILDWWLDRSEAREVASAWLKSSGVLEVIRNARAGTDFRRTRVLSLAGPSPAWVIVAVSTTADGRSPVMGFAAGFDPKTTTVRALSELFQMEFGLRLALLASQSGDAAGHEPIFQRIGSLEGERKALISPWAEISPAFPNDQTAATKRKDRTRHLYVALGTDAYASRLTVSGRTEHAGHAIPVWRVVAPGLPSLRTYSMRNETAPL